MAWGLVAACAACTASPAPTGFGVAATSTSPVWETSLATAPPRGAAEAGVVLRWHLGGGSPFGAVSIATGLAGLSTGPGRNDNWTFVPARDQVQVNAGGPAVAAAAGRVPAAEYLRVFVSGEAVTALDGTAIVEHIEPIVLPVAARAGVTTTIDIELVVLPRAPASGGGHAIFVRDARVVPEGEP